MPIGFPQVSRNSVIFPSLVWLLTVLTAAAFAWAGWVLYRDGDTRPNLGWTQVQRADGWYVARVDAAGPATRLRVGDRLLALNGDPEVARAGAGFHQRRLRPGDTYHLVVRRDGTTHDLTMVVAAAPGALARRLPYVFIGFVWCAVSLFIGFLRSELAVARLAVVGAAVAGLLMLVLGLDTGLYTWAPMHAVVGYHFFYRFPGGVPSGRFWNFILVILYVSGGLVVGLGQLVNAFMLAGGPAAATALAARVPIVPIALTTMATLVFAGALVAIVLVIVRNYRLLPGGDARRRIRWVAYGSIAGVTPAIVWTALALPQGDQASPGVLIADRSWILFTIAVNTAAGAVPLSVAYAVVKHRVFDVSVAIRRGLQYLLARQALQALLALPVLGLAVTIIRGRDQTIGELVTGSTSYLYLIAGAAVSLRFRRPVRVWLDRRFFREQYDQEQLLVGLLEALERVDSIAEISRLNADRLERALHPKTCYLWFSDGRELALSHSSGGSSTRTVLPHDAPLVQWLERQGDVVEVSPAALPEQEWRWIELLGVHLIVPMRVADGRLLGVIMLGEKKSEEPYSATDKRLLVALAKQTAVVRDNLRLHAQVAEERRVRHDVLARLDGSGVTLLKECPACGACFDAGAERCDRDGEALVITLPIDRTLGERYRLDRLIGRGGMGAVYDARDLRLDRAVAVKVMVSRDFGQRLALRRFQREAHAVARLNHRNIVAIHDYGVTEPDGAYLVMERVPGHTLRAELARAGSLDPAVAAQWIDQLLDGLAAAHRESIVHRDLKPENIIGQRLSDGTLAVKILDFGLAKLLEVDAAMTGLMTVSGTVVGTLGYMAPEQLAGGDIDQRTDLFAVGVILAEMLTGRRPFQGSTHMELFHAVMNDAYHLPGAAAELRALDAVLQQCLAKSLRDRIASADALRAVLVPALGAAAALTAAGGVDSAAPTQG